MAAREPGGPSRATAAAVSPLAVDVMLFRARGEQRADDLDVAIEA